MASVWGIFSEGAGQLRQLRWVGRERPVWMWVCRARGRGVHLGPSAQSKNRACTHLCHPPSAFSHLQSPVQSSLPTPFFDCGITLSSLFLAPLPFSYSFLLSFSCPSSLFPLPCSSPLFSLSLHLFCIASDFKAAVKRGPPELTQYE